MASKLLLRHTVTGSRCCIHDQGLKKNHWFRLHCVCVCPLGLRSPQVVAKLKPTGSLVVEQNTTRTQKEPKCNAKNTKRDCVQSGQNWIQSRPIFANENTPRQQFPMVGFWTTNGRDPCRNQHLFTNPSSKAIQVARSCAISLQSAPRP